jgi:hypothetical protein
MKSQKLMQNPASPNDRVAGAWRRKVRLGTSRRRLVEVIRLITMGLLLFGTLEAAETTKAAQDRAVIDGDVITGKAYTEYRQCVAAIPLGQKTQEYNIALEKCKEAARKASRNER